MAVLFGGRSSEHAVSLQSAAAVVRAMEKSRFEAVPVGITRAGRWLLFCGSAQEIASGAWEAGSCTPVTLSPDPADHGLLVWEQGGVRRERLDAAFPVLHGKNGEDGTLQGLLELAGLPYVGCGVLGSAVCMDKITANRVLDAAGIPRCAWDCMEAWELPQLDAILARVEQRLGWPVFVKPSNAGSSVGISKAKDAEAFRQAVTLALRHDSRIVFERFVRGQEVECAVRGNDSAASTLPGEVLASDEFYTYDDKYISGTSRVAIPARLSEKKQREVQALAVRAYRALGCRGLTRVDFFVEEGSGQVLVNEANTMPGFTDISMYPKLMLAAGESYAGLLDSLIALALEKAAKPHGKAE